MTTQPYCALQVDERQINAHIDTRRESADWWQRWRQSEHDSRCVVVSESSDGEVVRVRCNDRAQAEELERLFVAQGIVPGALEIVEKSNGK